jgi:glyoxylase-like metal-dependent hydrolase (beta-lactamase superfamily II)
MPPYTSEVVPAETFEAASRITGIDTQMAGRTKVTSAYLLPAAEPALIETGPTTSVEAVLAGLRSLGLGKEDLAHIIVTHIHLDHAGGVGRLSKSFPRASVWVHERGAPHLVDPAKLVSSAARVYGDQRMSELFGPVDPVAESSVRPMSGGDQVSLGDRTLDVLYTPGHASHHVSLVDAETGAVFTGDALGVHLPDVRVLRPATPPPDIDIELGVDSIRLIKERARSVLMFSHFGPVTEVEELCSLAERRLRKWANIVREGLEETDDLDRIAQLLTRRTAQDFAEPRSRGIDWERYDILADMRINAAGLVRYWKKRADAEQPGSVATHPAQPS